MTTPTPEAIEAAARALYQDWWNRNEYETSPASPAWEDASQYHREMYLIRATAALTAAAPLIAAHALRDAADDPALRLSGHSGISITRLRARAATIEGKDS